MASPAQAEHVMAKAAAEEIAEAKLALKAARALARSLGVLGRAIEREMARLPVNQRAALLTRLHTAIAERLDKEPPF